MKRPLKIPHVEQGASEPKRNGLTPAKLFRQEYNVGNTKFYQLLNSGAFRAVKIGKRTYVVDESAESWKANLPVYKPAPARTPPARVRAE